jgi:FMN-dependent NADH-azoreductase
VEVSVPNLLHLDASIRPTGSSSRVLSAAFAQEWQGANPDGGYRYRDLATAPVPHLTHTVREYRLDPGGRHPDVSEAERRSSDEIVDDLRWATTVLMGTPMYNYSVPSTVKAWLDHFIVPAYLVELVGAAAPLRGKSVVVVTARGNAYSPGMGRADRDLQEPYLRAIFAAVGIENIAFVHAELTMAKELPALSSYRPLADQSMESALAEAKRLARRQER